MTSEFYVLIFGMFIVLSWHMSMQNVLNSRGQIILAHTASGAKQQFARLNNIPQTHVVLYKHDGYRKKRQDTFLLSGRWSVKARPIVGDHIHMAISFWINNKPRPYAEHDRPPIENIPYETGKDTDICLQPGNISYQKMWPHAGIHTHCDGLIHVHPWSAPRTLRQEGLDVQLGMWFDQVGIEYRELPQTSIKFKDGTRFDSNETHQWHIAEKKCFKNTVSTIYTEQLDTIWLGYAYASYVAWFGPKNSAAPDDIDTHIEHLKQVGAYGAYGEPYPHSCS